MKRTWTTFMTMGALVAAGGCGAPGAAVDEREAALSQTLTGEDDGGGDVADCGAVSNKLVPACGAWLGASSYRDAAPTDWSTAIGLHEGRIGRSLDILHGYHKVGSTPLSGSEIARINDRNKKQIVFLNWKPAAHWADASGNGTPAAQAIDKQIDAVAVSIQSVSTKKIMLTLFHEPENDLVKKTAGTAADYVAMWHNVRKRFDALQVTNVVWVWNVMLTPSLPQFRSVVLSLYPGDAYVDWIMWNPYSTNRSTYR